MAGQIFCEDSISSKIVLCQDNVRGSMARIIDGDGKNIIGGNVRAYRMQMGLSQQQVSDRLEVLAIYICRGSISRIEDKQRTVTDIELFGLSRVLGVSIEALIEK